MSLPAETLDDLLTRINGGAAAEALPELEALLAEQPAHPGLLTLRAEALRCAGRMSEAGPAYRESGRHGGGVRSWLLGGLMLAADMRTDEALACLSEGVREAPDNDEVVDAIITTLFNANRQQEALSQARHQLTLSHNPRFLCNAALVLQSTDHYEESSEAFKRIVALAPDDPAVAGAALTAARFTCEWAWIAELQARIGAWYAQGRFDAPQEYPLTNLTWCADEAVNLGVTRAYAARMVPVVAPLPQRVLDTAGRRIRVGYLSCDFRNHATMHLMAGLFEHHDRERFEVFAYDHSSFDISDYRQRFLDAIEHHVPVHGLSDQEAALRIAADGIDVLFDLKLYTGGGRTGILAYRPAPLQLAWLGFPGSAAHDCIDYIIADRFVTPDSSTPFYPEKFCRLPHSYQCNDRKRQAAAAPGSRAEHGLPEDKVVFAAFNQSYKVDRGSFEVWLRILRETPDSVLWLLGQCEPAIRNLSQQAVAAGLDPSRLIFAPFAAPQEHLARLQLADAALDALVCNGHTTTSDALWAGVPVITARGRHFASRVSESLLNAIGLPELVGADVDGMVAIARRIAEDTTYRHDLRQRLAEQRLSAPLFDTARFTRDLESAIALLVSRREQGLPDQHVDVPDAGPLDASAAAPRAISPLRQAFAACPLCAGLSVALGHANCTAHPLWHEPLPATLAWMHCPSCGHVHSREYWTPAGLAELQRAPAGDRPDPAVLDARPLAWAPVVDRVVTGLGGHAELLAADSRPVWLDAGSEGALAMLAADHGCTGISLEPRAEVVSRLTTLGVNVIQNDFMGLSIEVALDVLSLVNVPACVADPRALLAKAASAVRAGGLLVVSVPDFLSSQWKRLEVAGHNPYWMALAHHHQFSRQHMVRLLDEAGFAVTDFMQPGCFDAQMVLLARRR